MRQLGCSLLRKGVGVSVTNSVQAVRNPEQPITTPLQLWAAPLRLESPALRRAAALTGCKSGCAVLLAMAVTPYPVIPARIGHSSGLRLVPEEQQQANADDDDLLASVAIDAVGEPLEA